MGVGDPPALPGPHPGFGSSRRLAEGQVKEQAERQRGFDGNLGVLQLSSTLADAHSLPRGDRFRRQPQGSHQDLRTLRTSSNSTIICLTSNLNWV